MKCKICNSEIKKEAIKVKEMMFGFNETFEYVECSECGSLQIIRPPDISKFYPEAYYSKQKNLSKPDNYFLAFIRHQRAKYGMYEKSILGKIVSRVSAVPKFYQWFRKAEIDFSDSILDVGCGSGKLLLTLRKEGFNNLTGIDLYIEKDIFYGNGVRVLKKELANIDLKYDFIMLNHSFEHMEKPLGEFKELNRILKPGRYLMIRTPVANSYAFKKYGANWVQIDAPRHQFIYTKRSIQLLAEKTGFKLVDVAYDSSEFQFWGSEQYQRGIHLMDDNSYSINPSKSIFSKNEIESFRIKAIELNEKKEGDQAVFYLCKIDNK